MSDVTKDPQALAQQPEARLYHSPQLFVYGAMRELTASGTGMETEGMMAETNKMP